MIDFDERVEVAPGVIRRLADCTVNDLAGAQDVAAEQAQLRASAVVLLEHAARDGVDVPAGLRERLADWAGDLPAARELHGELAGLMRQEGVV